MNDTQFEELVYLLVDGRVTAEMLYENFEQYVDRQLPIEGAPPGASLARAAFVVVGPELRIQSLVFFLVQFDAHGRPDKNFNVPLPYLARNAGSGPDLGHGQLPMACRGRCSVPWQANNLWDPALPGTRNPMDALVAAVQNNRLQLSLELVVELCDEISPEFSSEPSPAVHNTQIAELSVAHAQALVELQKKHDNALVQQREVLEAKIELYQAENQRLLEQLNSRDAKQTNFRGAARR